MARGNSSIPKDNGNPWRIVWEKLILRGDFLSNENRIPGGGQTRSKDGRSKQLGASLRAANAEIQSGSHFVRTGRPSNFDPLAIYRVVGLFQVACIADKSLKLCQRSRLLEQIPKVLQSQCPPERLVAQHVSGQVRLSHLQLTDFVLDRVADQ
jgi:hypothetical protein